MVTSKEDVTAPVLLRPNKSGTGRGRSVRQGTAPRPVAEQPRQVVQVVARPQASPQGRGGGQESRATARSTSTAPLKARKAKLVDGQWAFQARHFSKFMTKGTDYVVIGVLGAPGAGKSRLMNELCGLHQQHGNTPNDQIPFEVAAAGAEPLKHCTTGVDIRVSTDRVIAIDTQPVQSSSVLLELLQADSPPAGLLPALQNMCSACGGRETKPVTNVSAEAVAALMDLQLTIWLLRVCHVVVVMTNDVYSPDMWWLLSSAGMLQGKLPELAVPAGSAELQQPPSREAHGSVPRGAEALHPADQTAHVVLGATAVDFGLHARDDIIRACTAATHILEGSGIKLTRHVCVPSWLSLHRLGEQEGSSCAPGDFSTSSAPGQQPRDLARWSESSLSFLLPCESMNDEESHGSGPSDNPGEGSSPLALSKDLCHQVLALHRQQRKQTMSEQEWLVAAEHTWNAIRQSVDLGEYVLHLQEARLQSAGGWRVS